jgi:predicted RNase H-like HicB family nuclease
VELDVVIEQDEDGMFIADVPVLPGCHTQGRTREEAMANLRDAIGLYLETKGPPITRVVGFERITIEG